MEEKYNAIVVKTTDYRDNDKMIKLFTLEEGLVSACLRGVKKANAKLKCAGEPFCFGEFVLAEKSGRRTVIEVNQIDGFYDLRLDSDKFYCASCVVEFVSAFLMDGMKSYELFLSVINTLKFLCTTKVDAKKVLICYYLNALRLAGYQLDFEKCEKCGKEIKERAFFSFEDCVSACESCADAFFTEIRFSTYSLLKDCSKNASELNEENLLKIVCDEQSEVNALRFLDYIMQEKAGVSLKSHKYFIETFN